jgi:thiamine-phosphate pyrophosphorylase
VSSESINPFGRQLLPSPLYPILEPGQAKGRSPIAILQDLLKGGAGVIQLRAKEMVSRQLFDLAVETRSLTRNARCLFIVNDRVDIAMATDADGVHLGQEDLPLSIARRIIGAKKIIGISTHDLAQAREAETAGADYIGFGPIFGTSTKETGYSARGLSMLREVRKTVKIPIVAIGGITESNVTQVWDAGADAAAIISDLMGASDIEKKVRKIISLRPT